MHGTWQCSECETINAPGHRTCQACLSPAPRPSKGPASSSRPGPSPSATRTAGGSKPWTCPECETVNAAASTVCTACREPVPGAAPRPPASKPKAAPKPVPPPGPFRGSSPAGSPAARPPRWTRTPGTGLEPPRTRGGITGLGGPSGFFLPGAGTSPSPPSKPAEPGLGLPSRPDGGTPDRPTASPAGSAARWPPPPSSSSAGSGHGPPPYRPRRRRSRGPFIFILILVIGAGTFVTRSDWLPLMHHIIASKTPSSPQAAARPPCPAEIAASIQDGAGSTVIASYVSPGFEITICQTTAGKMYYHGVSKTNSSLQITLPARWTGWRFEARNNSYIYYVSAHRLLVTEDGAVIVSQPLRSVT
jgi:hypothetical protein